MEDGKFRNLELWMIIAFYMENEKQDIFQLKDIISNLEFQIKYKNPAYENFSETKIKNIVSDDILKSHSNIGADTPPFIFTKIGHTWALRTEKWELWKKDNKEKSELYKEFIDFCKNNEIKNDSIQTKKNIGKTKNTVSIKPKTEKEKFTQIKEYLKENILRQCNENNIYLLGQLVFNIREYKYLCEYAKYCVHKKQYSAQEDIVLWTAFVKILQKKAEETLDPWDTIFYEVKFDIKSKKQDNYIYKKRKDGLKNTLSYYNSKENTNLYCIDTDNRNLLMAHAFILKKQIHEYCSILTENKNLSLNNLVRFINKSGLSKYSKNIVNDSNEEQLECLFGMQLNFLQNKDTSLCKKDYFVNELNMYIVNPDKYKNRQNYIVKPGKKDNPPYLMYKNNDLYIHIPTQNIENEVNIAIVFSNNEKIEQMAYLYNDSIDIKIDKKYIKNIFDEIKIFFNGYCHNNPIPGKPYRFFENNGREKLNITSVENNPAILLTQKNVEVKNMDFIREVINEEYKQYLISLKDRSKHIEIDGILFYLNTIEKSDLELELAKIDYIKSASDIEYSIIPPKIIIRGDDDMRMANLIVKKCITEEYVEFTFDEAKVINLEENNDVIYIFDMEEFEISNFFEKDNLYKVEYNYKNKKLTKEFVIIDNINIEFEKELYLNKKEIRFFVDSPYFLAADDNIIIEAKNNNILHCCYKFIDNQSNYIDRPVKFEIPLQNGKTYSLQVDFPIASFNLTRNTDNVLIKKEDYLYKRNLETEFELNLPSNIELNSTPALVVDGKIYYFKNNNGKYTIGKDKIIESDNDKPYKKNLKLYIQTNNSEYNINIGKIYNRPEGQITVNKNEDGGITIETHYDKLNGYPPLKMEINNIISDWELVLPSDEFEIPQRELVDNETYTITTYIDEPVKIILDKKEYTYVPNNRIDKEYLEIDAVITTDNIERNVAYYIINNIEYIGKDVYKGQVNYCKSLLSYKLLCELYFKVHKKDNKYIIIPDGEYNLSYIRSGNGKKWILTSISNVKSNIFKLICK